MLQFVYRVMTVGLTLAAAASGAYAEQPIHFDPGWLACEQVGDCVVETGTCNDPTAINKNYRDSFLKYARYEDTLIDCESSINPDKGSPCRYLVDEAVVCKDHRCGFNRKDLQSDLKECTEAYK